MGEGVEFQTFTLPEEHSLRLLVKNLDRGMPDSVFRKELESLYFHYQAVTQLRSGRRDKTRPKTVLSIPLSCFGGAMA